MSIIMQINPFDFFTDTRGDALDAGYIWIGQVNLDPRQYPVVAYYDEALTIPAPMPLRTSNGYIVRNGSPTFLYIDGNYSILVQDKQQRQVFYVPDFLMISSGQAVSFSDLSNTTDPTKGAAMVGRGVVTLQSVVDIATAPLRIDLSFIVKCYHPGINNGGGGRINYDPTIAKTAHNGGTIFSPTVPWNGQKATLPAYLLGSGETDPTGSGCFVRRVSDYYTIPMFGAVADWNGTTGFDNRPSIEAGIKNVPSLVISKGDYGCCLAGSIFIQGFTDKRIYGSGTLHKMGSKGIFSFNTCNNIQVSGFSMDGQIVADEAANGSIVTGTRLPADFTFAVSFTECNDCSANYTTVYDFAWDGLRAIGLVAAGGATATQSRNIDFIGNVVSGIRGTQIWMKAVSVGKINQNRQRNDVAFGQKGNAIYVVEWCDGIEVASNRQFSIGDNGIGVGEPDNNAIQARNINIDVHDNLIYLTRYHSILIAQAEDSLVHDNIIHRSGAKSVMAGPSSVVLTGGITVLGGGSAPPNFKVKVYNNSVIDAFEYGIYILDRPGTLFADASTEIEVYRNTITGFGVPTTTTRIASGGITSQLQVAPVIHYNTTDNGLGDGLRVFGDADINGHKARGVIGTGINIPTDTLLGNTRLTTPIRGCETDRTTSSGISIASKDSVRLIGCTTNRGGIGGAAPGVENTASALQYAGIGIRSVGSVVMIGCEALSCGSSGLVTQFCPIVKDVDGIRSKNGQVFTVDNFQSGAYLEGDGGNSVKSTFINPIMDGGTTQFYPIRVLFGDAAGVALDPEFVNHSSVSIGITVKNLINI